jgi:glycosyltransferase involved in cell wall biosynthesis
MPRLLIATTVPETIDAFLVPYARHFRSLGWQVDAASSGLNRDSDCAGEFEAVWDIPWSRSPFRAGNVDAPRRLRQALSSRRYDIVHVHTPVAGFLCRWAMRRAETPVCIYTAHGFHFHEDGSAVNNSVFVMLETLAGRWTDYLVVINRKDHEAARIHRLVPEDRLMYMPGIGLDTGVTYSPESVAAKQTERLRNELGISAGGPVFLVVAEFVSNKRHQDAIHAFTKLGRRDAHLLCAGCGPTLEAMRRLAARLGVDRRVHFLGVRKDVPVLMRAAAALLLCSNREGLPRSVMEALSLEVPVIGTDIRGTRDLIGDGAGYLYPVSNVDALSAAMTRVLELPDEARRMAAEGRRRIAGYDIRHVLRLHEDLYLRALAQKHKECMAC